MKLTAADIYQSLSSFVPGGMTYLEALSQVQSRYYDEGLWKDLMAKVVITGGNTTGFVTLDRRYLSLEGIAVENGLPMPVYGAFHEWQELGMGYIEPDELSMNGVVDMGDGFVTTADIATEGTLRLKIYSASDAGKKARIHGYGTVNSITGQRVFDSSAVDGIQLTLVDPTADTTQTFSSVSDLQLPENMVGVCELYVVNGATATLLGRYEPGECRPCYRRYKLGTIESTEDVIAYCKLRFTPYRNNSDFVVPACVGAIKAGFQALTKENALNYKEAFSIWAYGKNLLQNQLKAFKGAAKPGFGWMGKQNASSPSTVS
jgi:hypothetical protein